MTPWLMGIIWLAASLHGGNPVSDIPHTPKAAPKAEISFHLHRGFLVIVSGSIDGVSGLHFVVDTASGRTIIDQRFARQLRKHLTHAWMAAVDTGIPVSETTIAAIKVGTARFDSVPVLVRDLRFLRKPFGRGIDGILGLDLLARTSFSVDYRTHKLVLGDCVARSHRVPLVHDAPLLAVPLQVAGHAINVLVDTAASDMELFARKPVVHAALATREAYGIAGRFAVKEVRLPSARLGDDDLGSPHAFVVHSQAKETEDFDGLFSPAAVGITSLCVDTLRGEFSWTR